MNQNKTNPNKVEARRARRRKYYKENKEKVREWQRKSVAKNVEKHRAREKAWRQRNPNRDAEYAKRWREKDPERVRQLANERMRRYRDRMKDDPAWVLRKRVSARMLRSLKSVGGKKRRGWEVLVGYTLAELRAHIEAQFKPGMTWENMGLWHIDHVRPISSFNVRTVDDPEFKVCWALENLQPLWARENLKKYNKVQIAYAQAAEKSNLHAQG